MKFGIISDIHSNILALEAVFKRFEEEKIDKVICLGDIIGIGPYPEKCVEFLMERKEQILSIVRGNHEGYLLKEFPIINHNGTMLSDEELDTHRWNHSKLSEESVSFIQSLNKQEILEIEGKKILVCHYPLKENGKFKKFYKNMDEERIEEIFNEENIDVFLFGHTHKACYFENNNRYIINPGSLGCPKDTDAASAGILQISKDKIKYENIEVEYNVSKVVEEIEDLKYPLYKFMIKTFYKKL